MKTNHQAFPGHHDKLVSLKRIEGQVRGITKMIEEGKYCVDIVNQINAATNALHRVAQDIFSTHLETCVTHALRGKSEVERQKKINEVLEIMRRMY